MPTDAITSQRANLTFEQLTREQRLQVIVRKGLPPFRQTALELSKVLGGASPDMGKAAKLISTDPTLSSQVLRMCNSPLLGLHSRVISIDHATTLLGLERLRSLVLTSSMADFAGKALPDAQMSAFWEHSFMTALLSQFLAERWRYFEKYQAYIAGLLHDIGQIPEWILLSEGVRNSEPAPSDWLDNPGVEQEYFGTDHCRLGGTMARSWGLMPSFLDALENHHTPELAQRDSVLVRIVATADNFLSSKIPIRPERDQSPGQGADLFVQLGQGLFGETGWPSVKEALELEYARILPTAKAGLNGLLGKTGSGRGSADDPGLASDVATQADPYAARFSPPHPSKPQGHRSAPTSFLSRCKSFMASLFS